MDNGFKVNRGINLAPQSGTPSNPTNGDIYYDSSLSKFRKYENGLWSDLGSGGSGSGKNYLSTVNGINGNGDFELGTTTKWSLFNTTLTSLVPTGAITAGAASITTFDTVSSGQLSGTYSLRTASSGAWAAGAGVISDAFTLETEDLGVPMAFSVSHKVFSGATNGNFSGTSANTFHVYFYDVTNSVWVQPTGVYAMISNGVGKIVGTIQPAANATSYRMAIIAANASAGAISVYWDSFKFGPDSTVQGTNSLFPVTITKLTAVTTSTYNTPAGVKWLRIRAYGGGAGGSGGGGGGGSGANGGTTSFGSLISCPGGTVTGQGGIPIPSLVATINAPAFGIPGYGSAAGGIQGSPSAQGGQGGHGGNTPLLGGGGGSWAAGTGSAASANSGSGGGGGGCGANSVSGCGGGGAAWAEAIVINPASSYSWTVGGGGGGGSAGTGGGAGGAGAAGQIIIEEYYTSYGAADDRLIIAKVSSSATTTVNNTAPTVPYVAEFDSAGGWDGTNTYKIPVSGYYEFSGMMRNTGAGTPFSQNNQFAIGIKKNGSSIGTVADNRVNTTGTLIVTCRGSNTFPFVAGDLVTFTGISDQSTTLSGSTNENFITIRRVNPSSNSSGVPTTVSAKYSSSAGNSIPNGANTIIDFATKVWDSHNAALGAGSGNKPIANTNTGWRYPAPVSGLYAVASAIHITSGAAGGSVFLVDVYVNGVLYVDGFIQTGVTPAAGDAFGSLVVTEVMLKANDYVEIAVFQSNGTRNMQAVATRNYVTITRIGSYLA